MRKMMMAAIMLLMTTMINAAPLQVADTTRQDTVQKKIEAPKIDTALEQYMFPFRNYFAQARYELGNYISQNEGMASNKAVDRLLKILEQIMIEDFNAMRKQYEAEEKRKQDELNKKQKLKK